MRYAARWILGVLLNKSDYRCPFCGLDADAKGLHATACHATGAPTTGHNVVNLVLGAIYRAAGATVLDFEKSTPANPQKRPADILVRGISGRPLAIDITIWSRTVNGNDPLDKAIEVKVMASAGDCRLAGWTFKVWAADVYGAVHPLARRMINVLSRLVAKQRPLEEKDGTPFGNMVWRAVSAAVISRAASHHLRHSVALSAASVAEPAEDILGISQALPDVSDMLVNNVEAEGDIEVERTNSSATLVNGDGCSESFHQLLPPVAPSGALVAEPIEVILGTSNALPGADDGAAAMESGDGGSGSEVERLVDKRRVEGGMEHRGATAAAVGINVDPPAAQYVNNPYWPPPGAMELTA